MLNITLNQDWNLGNHKDNNIKSKQRLKQRIKNFNDRLDLALNDNDIMLITGSNGSGKTTLLQEIYLSSLRRFGSPCWEENDTRIITISPKELTPKDDKGKTVRAKRAWGIDVSSYNVLEFTNIQEIAESYESYLFPNRPSKLWTELFNLQSDCRYLPFYFDAPYMGALPKYDISDKQGHYTYKIPVSHRQGHNMAINLYADEIRKIHNHPLIFFLDEPENGADMKAQKTLLNNIRDNLKNEKDIALVATNNPFLIYSKLPRIDLDDRKDPFSIKYEKKRIKIV